LVREAQNAESRADFVHKLGIAQKECDETIYWLELLAESEDLSETQYLPLKQEAESLLKIIKSSILTAKKNMQK
jgi:four helix bundle protein